MNSIRVRVTLGLITLIASTGASADTFYGFCYDIDDERNVSSLFTYEGTSRDYEVIKDQWEVTLAAKLGKWERLVRGKCWASGDRAKAEEGFQNYQNNNNPQIVPFAPVKKASAPSQSAKPADEAKPASLTTAETKSANSRAQVAAEEIAKRRAEREAEFQAKQAEYERKLAEQQKMVEDYKRAQEDVARTKAEQQAKADAAAAAFGAEQQAYAEKIRQHDEQEAAARQLLAEWDKRNGLGSQQKASTDDDANRCITTPETKLNASFKGNTAASIINGCGQSVDVRICLMTTKGWNCGVTWGLASQQKWSFSSFNATGPVFVDARVSRSPRALASPQ
jgi:hypothetical protein